MAKTAPEILALLAGLDIFASFFPNRAPPERAQKIAKLLRHNSIGVNVANNLWQYGTNIEAPTHEQFVKIIHWVETECRKMLWGQGADEATWPEPIFIVIGTAVSTHVPGREWPQNTARIKKLWEQGFVKICDLFARLHAHESWGRASCPIRILIQKPGNPTDRRVQAELIELDFKLARKLAQCLFKEQWPEQGNSRNFGICGYVACDTRKAKSGGYRMIHTQVCGHCHGEWYCSQKCQKKAWRTHRQFCDEIKWLHEQRTEWTETWSSAVVAFLSD